MLHLYMTTSHLKSKTLKLKWLIELKIKINFNRDIMLNVTNRFYEICIYVKIRLQLTLLQKPFPANQCKKYQIIAREVICVVDQKLLFLLRYRNMYIYNLKYNNITVVPQIIIPKLFIRKFGALGPK